MSVWPRKLSWLKYQLWSCKTFQCWCMGLHLVHITHSKKVSGSVSRPGGAPPVCVSLTCTVTAIENSWTTEHLYTHFIYVIWDLGTNCFFQNRVEQAIVTTTFENERPSVCVNRPEAGATDEWTVDEENKHGVIRGEMATSDVCRLKPLRRMISRSHKVTQRCVHQWNLLIKHYRVL